MHILLVSALALVLSVQACDLSKEPIPPSKGLRPDSGNGQTATELWHEKAYETYLAVEKYYGNQWGLYNENYPKQKGDGDASFLWPYDGMISGLALLNKLGYDVNYAAKVENYNNFYWSNKGPFGENVGGYSSGAGGYGERYFDDNSIVGINLVEAYNQLHDAKYLQRCANIVKFLKTGMDNTFGGGLWWCEQLINQPDKSGDGSNKPACANGFAQWFLLSYYDVCPEAEKTEVLTLAKTLYQWEYSTLRDDDNVYLNDKGADGKLHSTKWTYNTAAMIASGHRLYKITGEQHYLEEAITAADAAYNYFVRPRDPMPLSYPLNDPWFTIKLIHAYIELMPDHPSCIAYVDLFASNLKRGWQYGRQTNGLWYEDWTGVSNVNRDCSLLMQAAAIDALATVALYKGESKTAGEGGE